MRGVISLIIIMCFAFVNSTEAQMYKPKKKRKQFYGNQRLQKPLFKWVTGNVSRHGFQLQLGPTYMFTRLNNPTKSIMLNETRPAQYQFDPSGKIGGFIEVGMVHITKRPRKLIQYYDWGIGYKHLAGKEKLKIDILKDNGDVLSTMKGEGEFSLGNVYGRFGVHNVYQLDPIKFLDNALGVNLDYRVVGGNKTYKNEGDFNDVSLVREQTQYFQNTNTELTGQINYDFGFGFKMREGMFIIPGFRLPIFEAYDWTGGNPTVQWFSSKYQPAMFKLKFVWLFKRDPNRCPAVETNSYERDMQNKSRQ